MVQMSIIMSTMLIPSRSELTMHLIPPGSGNWHPVSSEKKNTVQSKWEQSSLATLILQEESTWPEFNDIKGDRQILKQQRDDK